MTVRGTVVSVDTVSTGSSLAVAATSGASTIELVDIGMFRPEGGTLKLVDSVDGDAVEQTIGYLSVDVTTNTITLDGTLADDYDFDTDVTVEPEIPVTTAYVSTDPSQQPIGALVPQELRVVYADALADGTREPNTGVGVVVDDVAGRPQVVLVQGAKSTVASTSLTGPPPDDWPIGTDGVAPTVAPTVTSSSVPGFGQLRWPAITDNPDPLLGYKVYVSATPAFTADDGTNLMQLIGGTLALVRTLPGGAVMVPGTTYYAQVKAVDGDGNGPASNEVSFTPGQSGGPDIAAGSITASMLQSILILASMFVGKAAPSVLTNKALTSNVATLATAEPHGYAVGAQVLVTGVDVTFNGLHTVTAVPSVTTFSFAKTASDVSSTATTGLADPTQRWEGDKDGIRFYDESGDILINLPTNASSDNPPAFYAAITAVGLRVLDNLSIQGLNNEFAAGSKVVMKSGTTKPSLAPTPVITYPDGVTWDYSAINFNGADGLDFDGTDWWAIRTDPTTFEVYLDKLDAAGGAPISSVNCPDFLIDVEDPVRLVVVGDHAYVDTYDGDDGDFYIIDVATGAYVGNNLPLPAGASSSELNTGVGHDFVNGYVTRGFKTSGGFLGWRTYDPVTLATIADYTTSFATTHTSTRVDLVAADFGANRWVATLGSDVKVFSVAGTPLIQANEGFPPITFDVSPLWDGTRFVEPSTPAGQPPKVRQYSQTKWTTESDKWWLTSTWRDSDATSPDYAASETDAGTFTSFTMKKRAWLVASVSQLASSPVDAVSFYLGRGTTQPSNANMWRQPPPAAGLKTQSIDAVVMTGTVVTDNPPATNSFPGGTPSSFESQNGGLVMDSEGNFVAPAKFQAGVTPMTPVASTPTSLRVDFDVPFATVPIVITGPESGAAVGPSSTVHGTSASAIDTDGFTLWIYRTNTTVTNVNWIAMVP